MSARMREREYIRAVNELLEQWAGAQAHLWKTEAFVLDMLSFQARDLESVSDELRQAAERARKNSRNAAELATSASRNEALDQDR